MKLTNIHGYPEPFVRAVTKDTYDRGKSDYTVSELINPPRLHQLFKRHDVDLTEDVSERLWVLDGIVAHEILARGGGHGELTEERLYATISGKKVGGKPDTLCLESGLLTDYKRTTVWSYIFGKPEWISQLNFYAFLARENRYKVTKLEVFAMFRDWSASKGRDSSDYPKTNCMRIPIEAWSHEETRVVIAEAIEAHELAKLTNDDELSLCTPQERWSKPSTWAIMKPGRKSALAVVDSERAAWQAVMPGQTVEHRPGKSTRCESYCPVRSICNQWAADPTNKGVKSESAESSLAPA